MPLVKYLASNNNNNNRENEANVPIRLINEREQPNPVFININQNADEVMINMQQNQIL